jgi:hypothetical protein
MFLHWSGRSSRSRDYRFSSISSQSAAETLTTQAKFGTYSANVRGAGYVQYYYHSDYTIRTQDFAIEFWYWKVETPPTNIPIMAHTGTAVLDSGSGLTFWSLTDINWRFTQESDGDLVLDGLGTQKNLGAITNGQWYHVCVSRTGTTLSTFLDGTRITTDTYSTDIGTDDSTNQRSIWLVGYSRAVPNDSDPGYFIDGFRLTVGSDAGYNAGNSSITVPTTMPSEVAGETRLRLNFEGTFEDIV